MVWTGPCFPNDPVSLSDIVLQDSKIRNECHSLEGISHITTFSTSNPQPFSLVWAIQKLCFHAFWVKYTSTFKLFPQGFDSQLAGPGLQRISFLSHNLQWQLAHCYIREGTDTHQNIEDKAFCCGWGKRHLLPRLQFLTTPRLAPLMGRQKMVLE